MIGYEIARALGFPLDIVVVRKIGHPDNPEYAICTVDEKGSLLCNETEIKSVDQKWLREEALRERDETLRRIKVYRGGKSPSDLLTFRHFMWSLSHFIIGHAIIVPYHGKIHIR